MSQEVCCAKIWLFFNFTATQCKPNKYSNFQSTNLIATHDTFVVVVLSLPLSLLPTSNNTVTVTIADAKFRG